jgi:hypothetical protein
MQVFLYSQCFLIFVIRGELGMDSFSRSRLAEWTQVKVAILTHAVTRMVMYIGGTLHVQPLLRSHVPKAAASLIWMIKHSFLHVTVQHYEEEKPGLKVHECVSVNLSVGAWCSSSRARMAKGNSSSRGSQLLEKSIAANRGRNKVSQKNSSNRMLSKVPCHQILNAQKKVWEYL